MKLRENLYQREIYGPRVRALRPEAGAESKALFDEFEKMLVDVELRLEEGLREVEILFEQTGEQLRILLTEYAGDGFTARFLTERESAIDLVFGRSLHALFEEIYGSASAGFERAGRSYLSSGYFEPAVRCFESASHLGASEGTMMRMREYALGMQAYVARDYANCVRHLSVWADAAGEERRELLPLALDAVSRIGQLAEGDDREVVARDAEALAAALGPAPSEGADRGD